jgi:hypothetical protein
VHWVPIPLTPRLTRAETSVSACREPVGYKEDPQCKALSSCAGKQNPGYGFTRTVNRTDQAGFFTFLDAAL